MIDKFNNSAFRYAFASAAALGIDLALTMGLRLYTPLSLTASAAISFVAVGIAFYFVHEFWTFRRDDSAWSGARLVKNFMVLSCGFAGRVGTIGLLEWFYTSDFKLGLVYFGIGVGVSFLINYFANKYLVFQPTSAGSDRNKN